MISDGWRRTLSDKTNAKRWFLSVVVVSTVCWAGCPRKKGNSTPSTPLKEKRAKTGGAVKVKDIVGVWDWGVKLVTDDGDFRDEKESWVFSEEENGEISGRYRRRVTVISRDGKPFDCNGKLRYRLEAEFRLHGKIEGGVLKVAEKSVKVTPGPCEKGKRRLDEYRGSVLGGELVLKWDGGSQTLGPRDLTGVWKVQSRRSLSNGDAASVQETWYIFQKGTKIWGEKHRRDVRASKDKKPYRCNGRLYMSRFVVWAFNGTLEDAQAELAFGEPLVKKSPCENRELKQKSVRLKMGYEKDHLISVTGGTQKKLLRQGGLDPFMAQNKDETTQ